MATWIFQGNPNIFEVNRYLIENEDIEWKVTNEDDCLQKIRINDEVYIWRANGEKKNGVGGVVARCIVTSIPVLKKDAATDYWIDKNAIYKECHRIFLVSKEVRVTSIYINRVFTSKHEILKSMEVISMPRFRTNFILTQEQSEVLKSLWSSNIENELIQSDIPIPNPSECFKTYNKYKHEQINQIIYIYLFEGKNHKWLDEFILQIEKKDVTLGYESLDILNHLGLNIEFKGLFEKFEKNHRHIQDAIEILISKNNPLFLPVISSLLAFSIEIENIDNDLVNEGKEYPEGQLKYKIHRQRERNSKLINDAKALFKQTHKRLFCEACEVDFYVEYGIRGDDFIEGHHKKMISELTEGELTKIQDIAMLCSNCHSMIHRKPLLTVAQLKELILEQRKIKSILQQKS